MPKTIVLTGPESTGKTTLAQSLGLALGWPVVEEYAREYLTNLGRDYTLEDVLNIAKEQEARIAAYQGQNVILDTDLTVISIWLKVKFDREEEWIDQVLSNSGDLVYLLCDIDLPWEPDPMREHPSVEDRKALLVAYKQLLDRHQLSYHLINGDPQARFDKALALVRE